MIPAGKLDVEEAGLTELERRCYELMQGTKQFCLNMDVRFGPEFGDLFNESAQAIIAGEDCGEVQMCIRDRSNTIEYASRGKFQVGMRYRSWYVKAGVIILAVNFCIKNGAVLFAHYSMIA